MTPPPKKTPTPPPPPTPLSHPHPAPRTPSEPSRSAPRPTPAPTAAYPASSIAGLQSIVGHGPRTPCAPASGRTRDAPTVGRSTAPTGFAPPPPAPPAPCSISISARDSNPNVQPEIISSSAAEFSNRLSIDANLGSALSPGIPIDSHSAPHSSSEVTAIAHQCPPVRIGVSGSFSGEAQG